MKRLLSANLLAVIALLLLLSVSSGTGGASASKAKQAKPHTLVTDPRPIRSFAQDAHSIAWIGSGYKVHVRSLSMGTSSIVGSAAPRIGTVATPVLALADTRALWTRFEGGNSPETSLWTSTLGGSAAQIELLISSYPPVPGGVFLSGAAGDGPTLVYGRTSELCDPYYVEVDCKKLDVVGGGVSFVTGQYEQPPISNIPAPAMLAFAAHGPDSGQISQGMLAVAPAASPLFTDLGNAPRVAEDGPVEVFSRSVLLSAVSPTGWVRAIALDFHQLAVLVEGTDGTKAVERYDPRHGTVIATTPVPKATAPQLSVSSAGVVYRAGSTIYLLTRTGAPKLVWKARGTPIGLSIEGNRIAWAVNLKGHGRVVALDVR
jgi:hypothetical protein